MRRSIKFAISLTCIIFSACSQSEFSGGGDTSRKIKQTPIPTTPNSTPPDVVETNPGSPNGPNTPNDADLTTDDGRLIQNLNADYRSCLELPKSGKTGYGKCGDNEVVVIVNDGGAKEMTCCPLESKSILTSLANEKHLARPGVCQADEVLTGMQDNYGSYCTKINTSLVKLSPPIPSIFVNKSFGGLLGQIANSYNIKDTCVCPEGHVAIGGHTTRDNRCTEKCVKIEKK